VGWEQISTRRTSRVRDNIGRGSLELFPDYFFDCTSLLIVLYKKFISLILCWSIEFCRGGQRDPFTSTNESQGRREATRVRMLPAYRKRPEGMVHPPLKSIMLPSFTSRFIPMASWIWISSCKRGLFLTWTVCS